MYYSYGTTQIGTAHLQEDGVCQDAHKIIKCDDTMIIAAVADGLGSEKYTDVAARLAVDTSTNYCYDKICENTSPEEILTIIKEAFLESLNAIKETAIQESHDLNEYDTTLSLAILLGETLYYGHSGDSGIIALELDGTYHSVAEQQRDDYGRVYPLIFEDKWVFGRYETPVCSVLLATDGMLDIFYPIYLKTDKNPLYISLLDYFSNPLKLDFDNNGEEKVSKNMEEFVKNISSSAVRDDKTLVLITNNSSHFKLQPAEYYEEPDWDNLKKKYEEEWKKLAYPSLYETQKVKKKKETRHVPLSKKCIKKILKMYLSHSKQKPDGGPNRGNIKRP